MVRADGAFRRSLARRYPVLGGSADAVVLVGEFADRAELAAAVEQLVAACNTGTRAVLEQLIDDVMAGQQVPGPSAVAAAAHRAQARIRLLRDFGGFTSAEIADRAGSSAANRSQLASRWRSRKRVFAVRFQGQLLYPGFQFSARGLPLPVIGEVLRVFDGWAPWDVAEWFVLSNGLLGRHAPVHLLQKAPDEVVEAARFDRRMRAGGKERS